MNTSLFNILSLYLVMLCCLLSLTTSNVLMLWILIEVCGFSLIYMFLDSSTNSNTSFSSFIFYLFNGISSILLVSGCYLNTSILVEVGVSAKFFIFPFSSALYYIFNNSNWLIILVVGSIFKIFLISLTFIINGVFNWYLLSLTLFVCIFFILFTSLSLKGLWFVLNLSSSCVLFSSCCSVSNSLSGSLVAYYLLLSLANIYILSSIENINNSLFYNSSINVNFLLFLVGFPVSMNLVYKILSVIILFSLNNTIFFIVWGIYSAIETIYMFTFFTSIISNFKETY